MSIAQFKDIEFFVQTDSLEVGRAQAEKDFPYQDKTIFVDMGLQSRRFPLRAYVLADPPASPQAKSAQAKARALMEACQSQGSGWLTLPWLGKFQVVNTKCQLTRPQGQARRIEFALEFVEAGELVPFVQSLPTLNTDALAEGLSETFAASLKPLAAEEQGAWQEALAEAAASLKKESPFLRDFNHLARTLLRGGGELSALLAPLSQMERSLSVLQDSISSLAAKPAEFAQSFLTLARQGASLAGDLGLNSTATAGHQHAQISSLLGAIVSIVSIVSIHTSPKKREVEDTLQQNPLAHNIQCLAHFKMLVRLSTALQQAASFKPAFRQQGEALAGQLLETLDHTLAQASPLSWSQQATVQGLLETATFEALNALHHHTAQAHKAQRHTVEQAIPLLVLAFQEGGALQAILENNPFFFNPLSIHPQTEIIL